MERTIASRGSFGGRPESGGLSLLFAPGTRPRRDEIERLASAPTHDGIGFAISHRPEAGAGWLELLAQGLTFDCAGLSPGDSAVLPPAGHFYGLDPAMAEQEWAVVSLNPGVHLVAGAGLLPVVRTIAGLGARIAGLPETTAVCWHAASSWMEPAFFIRSIGEWLRGGAFPALGLTALDRTADGRIVSLGLRFLIGQELALTPPADATPGHGARVAVRLIHEAAPDRAVGLLHVTWRG